MKCGAANTSVGNSDTMDWSFDFADSNSATDPTRCHGFLQTLYTASKPPPNVPLPAIYNTINTGSFLPIDTMKDYMGSSNPVRMNSL